MGGPTDGWPLTVDEVEVGKGSGPTKRLAKAAAARNALAVLTGSQETDAAVS